MGAFCLLYSTKYCVDSMLIILWTEEEEEDLWAVSGRELCAVLHAYIRSVSQPELPYQR